MANLRIVPQNWFDEAVSLTVTSEASTTMEIENAQITPRGAFWRSTSTAAQTIQGNWNNVVRKCNVFAVFRHNWRGGTVRLQLYSDTAWTTQVYDSTALTVSSTPAGSYDWGNATGVDPLLADAPYVLFFTEATTAKSFRITTGGTPADAYWQASRIWLGRYFEFTTNMYIGMGLTCVDEAEQSRSRGGSLRTAAGGKWRRLMLDFKFMSEAERQTWVDLEGVCGRDRDVVVSALAATTGRKERDHTLNAMFASLDPVLYGISVHQKRVVLEEV